jgi:hypothetical protein
LGFSSHGHQEMIHRWRRAPNVQTARRGRWIGLATPHCHANIFPSLLSVESHHLNIGSLYNMHADAAISLVVRSLSFLSSRLASETKEMDGVHATMIRESNMCLLDHQPNQIPRGAPLSLRFVWLLSHVPALEHLQSLKASRPKSGAI